MMGFCKFFSLIENDKITKIHKKTSKKIIFTFFTISHNNFCLFFLFFKFSNNQITN